MFFFLFGALSFYQEIEGSIWSNTRCAFVVNGIIAVSMPENLLFFDSDLRKINNLSVDTVTSIHPIKDSVLVLEMNQNPRRIIVDDGLRVREIGAFDPSFVSSDRNVSAFVPYFTFDPRVTPGGLKWPIESAPNLVQRFELKGNEVLLKGPRIMPLTEGQKRLNFNWKGFWIFEDFDNKLEIINQMNPAVYLEKTDRFFPIDLPGFVYKTAPRVFSDRIYTFPELRNATTLLVFSASQILGAYRYDCGYVLCYMDPGYPLPEFTRLAFFDEDWNRYGQIQTIPGRLIGIYKDQGYMITVPNEAWISEVRKVNLEP